MVKEPAAKNIDNSKVYYRMQRSIQDMVCLDRIMMISKIIILVALCMSVALSKVDIDYTHDVIGNGTIITDYRMGDQQTSVATGAIRGTGNVVNSYFFSTNNSSDLKLEDRFVLTKAAERVTTMAATPRFPPWPGKPGSYRLIGKNWAGNIEIGPSNGSRNYNSTQSKSLDVNTFLDFGPAKNAKGFDYRTAWSNSSNVSVRGVVEGQKQFFNNY
jgi:hypothetical protein